LTINRDDGLTFTAGCSYCLGSSLGIDKYRRVRHVTLSEEFGVGRSGKSNV
jgi:hypothetical protein